MRRFPAPWTVEVLDGGFKIVDANGQSLAYVYGHANPHDAQIAKSLTLDEARRIANNIAKLPNLLRPGLAVMPNSVARLVFRAVAVVLGKVRAADLLQMVVFGEIGSDQEYGCEGEPSKQNKPDHHKLQSLELDAARLYEMTRPLSRRCRGILFSYFTTFREA